MIDIGINLMNKQFKQDQEEIIQNGQRAGVTNLILTGTSVGGSVAAERFVANFSKKNPGLLFSTAGIHPHDAKSFTKGDLTTLENLIQKEHVVAVGECGLDFNRMNSPVDAQEKCFIAQLELAKKWNKPVFLHERDAHDRFVEVMEGYQELIPRSVVHCFTGSKEEVEDYLDRGFYIGITGWICDKGRGKNLREAVKHIPLDRIMIETDGPYLMPKDIKPRPALWRNEPKYLPHIAKTVAECMGVEEQVLIDATIQNTKTFFRLP